MQPHHIPLSTAISDPQYYHDFKGKEYVYKDKRGVYNGLRAGPLVPGPRTQGLCHGVAGCGSNPLPHRCEFLKTYRRQLDLLDFNDILNRIKNICTRVQQKEGFKEEPIPVLLVYETPNNPCSERWPIINWFDDHGIKVTEFRKD